MMSLKKLYNFLEKYKILTDEQFGFRRGISTTGAVMEQLKYLYENFDEGNLVFSLFQDFSKAFDCLDHENLLNKLRGMALE